MALTKHCIGDYIELVLDMNNELKFGPDDVMGMTITKEIIPTKADVANTDLSRFIVVQPGDFIFNPRTHGKRIGFGYNDTGKAFVISWNNIAFRIKPSMKLEILADYLFLHFNRSEWDREACYRSWGSSTEVFSWEALCEMEIDIPPLPIQQKYVDVYKSMLANQQSYERGLEDLKVVFEGYMDNLRSQLPHESIGKYIELSEDKNEDLKYGLDAVRGISIEKKLIDTKADMTGVSLKPYYLLRPEEFAYVTVTSRNGEKISLAINDTDETYICSSSYVVFRCKDKGKLLPQYLMLYFSRSEFNRYARFNSWGSARETFDWSEMCEVKIPIPNIDIQKAIADIYSCYIERKKINELLKSQLKDMCPILIKGSIGEVQKEA